MNGVKTKRLVWTIVFLGVTFAAIVLELIAGIWHLTGTIPWTEYIAHYVPWPIQLAAYVALAVWLPFHFWRHDHLRSAARQQGYANGRNDARVNFVPKIKEAHDQGYLKAMEDHGIPIPPVTLPEISVQRGGIQFKPPSRDPLPALDDPNRGAVHY
jgi:hypothetical protein